MESFDEQIERERLEREVFRLHEKLKVSEEKRDEAQGNLASTTDLANTWARERGVEEATKEVGLKALIGRLWDSDAIARGRLVSEARAAQVAAIEIAKDMAKVVTGKGELEAQLAAEKFEHNRTREFHAKTLIALNDLTLERPDDDTIAFQVARDHVASASNIQDAYAFLFQRKVERAQQRCQEGVRTKDGSAK